MRAREILKNINLLNVLLMAVLAVFGMYVLFPLLDVKAVYIPPAAKKTAEKTEEKAAPFQTPSIAEYTMIAEQNPFHPDRKTPVDKAEASPLPKPDFVLYGTMITDSVSIAYMEDLKAPYTTPGRGKRQTALKKGETFSGFTLKEIEKDKIVMARGEETIVVHLADSSKSKTRGGASAPAAQAQPAVAATAQPKAEEQKTAASAAQPSAPQPETEKKPLTPEKQKAAIESARKNLMDLFKQSPQRR